MNRNSHGRCPNLVPNFKGKILHFNITMILDVVVFWFFFEDNHCQAKVCFCSYLLNILLEIPVEFYGIFFLHLLRQLETFSLYSVNRKIYVTHFMCSWDNPSFP